MLKILPPLIFVLIIANIVGAYNVSSIFPSEVSNDNSGVTIFNMVDPIALPMNANNLTIGFNIAKGNITGYKIEHNATCNYTQINYTNSSNTTILSNTTIFYECWTPLITINPGFNKIKITGYPKLTQQNDGSMAYAIDWTPTLTISGTSYTQSAWDWWNATGGIVSSWVLNETTAINAVDSVGAYPLKSTGTTAVTGGLFGGYKRSFPAASGNYLQNTSFPYPNSNGWTLCAWVNSTNYNRGDCVASMRTGSDETFEIYLNTKQVWFEINPTTQYYTSAMLTSNGVRQLICTIYYNSSADPKVYVGNTSYTMTKNAGSNTGMGNGTHTITIGAIPVGGSYYNEFGGTIEQVSVWNYSLNQSSINNLYNGGAGNPYYNWTIVAPSNSCTPTVGQDFNINGIDNCNISSNFTNDGHNLIATGTGTTTELSNTTLSGFRKIWFHDGVGFFKGYLISNK